MLAVLNDSLAPWLLALSIPLYIHLLTRRTVKNVALPTVRFLKKTLANQSQIWRWRHLIMLLIRTLAIAAIVAAFLKPSWLTAFASPQGQRTGVVILIDVSSSMGYNSDGTSTFDKAKAQAKEVISNLHSGDTANIVFCGAQPTLAADKPTEIRAELEQPLQSAQLTEERADPDGAVHLAADQLGKTMADHQKLFVVSDFQRTNWGKVSFDSVPQNVDVLFVDVGAEHRENLGITSLRVRPTPPQVGETTTIQAEVFNSGDVPRTVPVDLRLSDGRHYTDHITVGPFASANVSFPLVFDKAERVELTATIPDDNLAADNTRRAVIDLRQIPTVILLTDEDLDTPTTAAFYISRALHPDPTSASGFRVLPIHPKDLKEPILKAADAVIVCNTPSMQPAQSKFLQSYVSAGGSLVWMLYGDRVQENLASFSALLPKSEPLPIHLQSLANIESQGKGYVNLAEARYESKLLKAFRSGADELSKAKFTKFWITSEVDPRAELLLKYEDGTAAAVKTSEGSGNLLLLNMSPAPSCSDLARQDFFVPLLHEFLRGILQKDLGQREANPGSTAATTLASIKQEITCKDPDGKSLAVTSDKTSGSVVVPKVGRSGFYHLFEGVDEVASIAVNPHPDETDLRPIDPRELETKRQREVAFLSAASAKGATLSELQHGLDLWPYLLLLALAFLLGEQAFRRVGLKVKTPRGPK